MILILYNHSMYYSIVLQYSQYMIYCITSISVILALHHPHHTYNTCAIHISIYAITDACYHVVFTTLQIYCQSFFTSSSVASYMSLTTSVNIFT